LEANQIARESLAQKIAFNEYNWNYSGKINLIGAFNLENAKIGAIVGRLLEIGDEIINAAIAEFKPLDNRLEFAGNFAGIDCYNDSLSTIQESAVAAINGLGDKVFTLIAGGFDRGQPFEKLAEAILDSNIKTLILFPTTGLKIWNEVEIKAKAANKITRLTELQHYFVDRMDMAADLAFSKTEKGGICLLSAASASFNGFRDYRDRGDQFKMCLAVAAAKRNE
jgi:UDP-N-acetylmuramoylalanine--D-glutamate ligase